MVPSGATITGPLALQTGARDPHSGVLGFLDDLMRRLVHAVKILVGNGHRAIIERDEVSRHSDSSSRVLQPDCTGVRSFIASEIGFVAIANDIIPNGARIPVRTSTAAKGKKTTAKGISRQSKAAINSFFCQGSAVGVFGFGATMKFVSVNTPYVVVTHHHRATVKTR